MKKHELLWVSKALHNYYGITSFRVIDIVKETELGICLAIKNEFVWLPKSHIYREKPAYLKGDKK